MFARGFVTFGLGSGGLEGRRRSYWDLPGCAGIMHDVFGEFFYSVMMLFLFFWRRLHILFHAGYKFSLCFDHYKKTREIPLEFNAHNVHPRLNASKFSVHSLGSSVHSPGSSVHSGFECVDASVCFGVAGGRRMRFGG